MATNDGPPGGLPEEVYAYSYDWPTGLNGLNPLEQDTAHVIKGIGLLGEADYKECLTIVAGSGANAGHSGPYPYQRDLNVETIRIVDCSHLPVFAKAEEGGMPRRVNFAALSHEDELVDGQATGNRIPVVTPLLPGARHPIVNSDGTNLGTFGIEEDGSLRIVRTADDIGIAEGHVRVVPNTDGVQNYIARPALEQVQITVHSEQPSVVQRAVARPKEDGAMEIDPGLLVAAKDSVTGATVTGILQRPMPIPRGQPGRHEQWVADFLARQQESQNQAAGFRNTAQSHTVRYRSTPR